MTMDIMAIKSITPTEKSRLWLLMMNTWAYFLELKGAGSRNMEYVLQAQNRDWYSFLNRCLDCGGVIRRFDLAINDMCGLLDIPVLSEKYKNGGADCRCKNYENVQGGKLSGKNRNLASTLYIGSKASTKYFCLYEKQKEQATKKKHTDIINRFEIRLRDKRQYRQLRNCY